MELEVQRFDFDRGYATTRGTVDLLTSLLREFHVHPRIVYRARSIVAGLPSMDMDAEIRAIWDFVVSNIRYVRDPVGAEWITLPAARKPDSLGLDELIDYGQAQEDCESIALYAAALLAAIGIPVEFEIQGRDPERPQRFTHCALSVMNPRTGERISFDPIGYFESMRPESPYYGSGFDLGDSMHLPGEPLERYRISGDQVLGALFGDEQLGDALANVEQYGNPIAQGLSQYGGPYGALVAAAYGAGTGAAQAAQSHQATPASSSSSGGSTIRTVSSTGGLRYTGARPSRPPSPEEMAAALEAGAGNQPKSKAKRWGVPLALSAGALLILGAI